MAELWVAGEGVEREVGEEAEAQEESSKTGENGHTRIFTKFILICQCLI